MAKTLAQFSIKRSGEDYLLTLTDEEGDSTKFTADYDQLDLIAEAIEEQLNSDEDDAAEDDSEDSEDEADEDE